jgi:hypothetical protein
MCQRRFKFLVVLLFACFGKINGQEIIPHSVLFDTVYRVEDYIGKHLRIKTPTLKYTAATKRSLRFPQPLSKAFYTEQLGFFCKKELEVEKKLMIPLRLRLGSLVYVNYLEQKSKAVTPVF